MTFHFSQNIGQSYVKTREKANLFALFRVQVTSPKEKLQKVERNAKGKLAFLFISETE